MEWIEKKLKGFNRRIVSITFDLHYFAREAERNLKVKWVEQTVRFGKSIVKKSTFPDRICFKMYFGKSNETYEVPIKIYQDYWEVKSAWKRKGKH